MKKINVILPFINKEITLNLIDGLRNNSLINKIYVVEPGKVESLNGCEIIISDLYLSNYTFKLINKRSKSDYLLFITKPLQISFGQFSIERMYQVAEATNAGIVYSDYLEKRGNTIFNHPLLDYQLGSVRDDFDFGPLVLINAKVLHKTVKMSVNNYNYAGWYDIRLKISVNNLIYRIPEFLYTAEEDDRRNSGEKQFDYVDPKNREVQLEMENAAKIGRAHV